jgi:hypothetical protein
VTTTSLPIPSQATNVIVRVVVVHAGSSSGTNWVTLTVAIAGLALSVASLGWQSFTFRRSGHRIRVKLAVGALIGGNPAELIYKKYPTPRLTDEFVKRGYPLIIIAIIRNGGRQAVTVEMCEWRANKQGTAGSVAGDTLPKKLEPGASCRAAFGLPEILMLLAYSGAAHKESKRKISATVHLGTGERIRSEPLRIPSYAVRHLYSETSKRTPSGVGWPDRA